jgi:AraC-like DNA-binding protein
MSRTRQPALPTKPDGDVVVRSFAVRFTKGVLLDEHAHEWHQLSYAAQGALRVQAERCAWIVPPHRAVWIPAATPHTERIRGQGTLRNLYLADAICGRLPRRCVVMEVPPLLRELIEFTGVLGSLDVRIPEQGNLARVIVDRLAAQPGHGARPLPMPSEPRVLAIASQLFENPADARSLHELAREVGASTRTAQRLFESETRLSFTRWRQRLRLLAAAEKLAQGHSVTETALDVGYASLSAFVAAFRRELGVSPGRYTADRVP